MTETILAHSQPFSKSCELSSHEWSNFERSSWQHCQVLPKFFTSHFVKNNHFFMENSRNFYSWRSALQYGKFLPDIIWLTCRTICNLKAYEKCYLIAISYLPILSKWNSQCPSKNVKFSIFWEIFYCHFDWFDKKLISVFIWS